MTIELTRRYFAILRNAFLSIARHSGAEKCNLFSGHDREKVVHSFTIGAHNSLADTTGIYTGVTEFSVTETTVNWHERLIGTTLATSTHLFV